MSQKWLLLVTSYSVFYFIYLNKMHTGILKTFP